MTTAGGTLDGFDPWADTLATFDDSRIANPELGSMMLYTSGTTGRPKGVYRADGQCHQQLLGETETGLVGSRFVSFLAAVTVTFILNARYTFGASIRDSRFPIYVLVQSLGAAITLGSYTALVLYTSLAQAPVVALIIGSAAATTSNFLLVRRFVYV